METRSTSSVSVRLTVKADDDLDKTIHATPAVRNFVNKLDHNQEEVRIRALDNIINKLSYGIVSSLDLACDHTLISKLLNWLQRPSTIRQTECLRLLLQLCNEEVACSTVVSLGGVQTLQSLKSESPGECQTIIDEILGKVYITCTYITQPEGISNPTAYTPSAQKPAHPDQSSISRSSKSAPIHAYEKVQSSPSADTASQLLPIKSQRENKESDSAPAQDWYNQVEQNDDNGAGFLAVEFPWITLCSTDIHVLESTSQSLVSQDPQLILSACEFLVDVMLFDFPAEIFLQRPLIMKTLIKLLSNTVDAHRVSDVSLAVVDTLNRLCDVIKSRINFHKDPITFAPKQDMLGMYPMNGAVEGSKVDSSASSSASASSTYSRPSVIGVSDDLDDDKTQSTSLSNEENTKSSHRSVSVQMTTPNVEEIELQDLQLLLPNFCLQLHKVAVSLVERCNNRLELELHRLLIKLHNVLELSINSQIWLDTSQYARELCDMLRLEISSLARVALKSHQVASSDQTPEVTIAQKRMTYILCSQLSLNLYSLVPSSKYSDVLGANEKQLLFTLCCDESLAQSVPYIRQRAADMLQIVDSVSYNVYRAASVICNSTDSYCNFLLASAYTAQDSKEMLKLIDHADKAIYSIPYHKNTELVPAYVQLCVQGWKVLDRSSAQSQNYMVNTLLKYLSHPLLDIKKLTYQSVVSHLKSCLSFDSPTHNKCDGIAFLLHHSILWEVACFGLSSDLPEVISCSQDLFSYLMQCRMLVSADMWKSVCDSLLPLLPVLQSYANADLTLGKCLLAFIDPHFDENISTLHCVKGAVRILFCRDSAARIDAAKVLMTRLNSTYNSHLLYPIAQTNHHANHIIHMGTLTRDTSANSKQPSLISDDSVTRVLRVFLEDGVEQSVRLTSLNQLSIILQNSLTHKFYLEKDGLEITLSTINESISPEKASIEEETVAPAISILASLLQYNQDIRQALAADVSSILTLLRCCWLFPSSSKTSIEAAQCLLYIVFNEISPISSLDVLSLPKTCCVRYKLPLRVLSYCDVSAHRVTPPPPSNDPITQPLPLQMLRIHWNIKWHGKVEHLLESLDREEKQGSGQFQLKLADILSLKESNSQYSIFRSLRTITNATTHNDVAQQLGTLTAYSQMCYLASDHKTLSTITWNTYFSRFLTTQPVAQIDKELLIRITAYFTSLLNMGMPAVNGNLLGELHSSLQGTKDSVLLSLLNDSAYSQATDSQLKRPLQNTLLSILSLVGTHTSSDSTSVGRPGRCYLVQAVLKRLTMADASNFYNLASLESSVYTLSRLTSSCGWSVGCSDIDSSFLCSQLIKALFEVLSAFHFGRQGNSSSYMGKGVLRNATLCLRYVVEEMTSVVQDTDSWLTRWVEGEEGQTRLQWLRSLWTYRDQEVRTAALGVSVALLHLSLGLSTVSSSVTDLVRDAVEVVVDSTECSLVRRQASVLLSNVIWNVIHHPTSDLDNKKELLNIHEVLRSANYYSEIFVILSSDIFLNTELNMDSLHRQVRPELGESVCNVVYPTLVTPSFLHSLLQCLILVTNSIPSATLPELETVQAAYHLIGFFLHNDDTVMTLIHDLDISDNSRVLLRNDVTSLCVTTISLLRSCIIQNKYMRSSSLSSANCRHVTKILSVLSGGHNQVESIEVLGTCKAIWCELFQYLTAHLHLDKDYEAFKILVIDNLIDYWQPLTSISMHILKVEDEESRICVLEFWTIILNTLHGYSEKEAVMARLDGADGEEKPCGALLYTCMLRIYDSLQLRYTDKDCVQERLALINCLKSLLAISHSAKLSALEAGFAETLLTHINSFIGKLNLLAMNKSGLLTEANVYLAELVVSLEVLTNFLSSFDEGKRAVSQGGLANLIHRLWFYCESDSQLMDTCVSMLITYTENSTLACRHLVCTSTVSCLGMPTDKLQIQSNSLADILVKLMQSQLNSININIGLLSKLFQLMSNFALAPDTLSVICKNAVVNGLVSSNPKVTIKRRPKLQTAVICLWIQFYLNLSYSLEGLQLILSVPDSVKFIVEQLSSVDSQSQLMILIILYNLCVGFRSKVLTIECVPLTALDILEDATSSQNAVDCALEILKALVYNSMKGKAVLKSLNIPERLEELVSTYKQDQMKYSSGRHAVKDRQSQIDNVLQILICIKE